MTIDFAKISPGGNTTILVLTSVPKDKRPCIATQLMSENYLASEQVGFLVTPTAEEATIGIEMMGGELCVNAIRSTAAYQMKQDPTQSEILIESSGSKNAINCISQFTEDGNIYSEINMRITPRIDQLNETDTLLELEGITHIVSKRNTLPPKETIGKQFQLLLRDYGTLLRDQPAIGFIPYTESRGVIQIKPLVFVQSTQTFIFETGCGSGSIAVALSNQTKDKQSFCIVQPSGTPYKINININRSNSSNAVTLGSVVNVLAEGKAFISSPFSS